ncbi:uncharacterized protein [Bemisia tabaci]|uniref:uncharacterized protein n=1 Tax=Bemisia tabaci TaxID=7038 RepID=UPI003B27F71B
MSCVRDTSPTASSKNAEDTGKQESKKRRFHPLRGLRRIFRRKPRAAERERGPDSPHSSREGLSPDDAHPHPGTDAAGIQAQCSRSASQLIQDPSQSRRSLHSTVLSVSHDSIFSPEIHPESQLGSVQSVQKLGHSNIRAELFDAVRRRKGREDTSEEDLGLPRSPLSNSLTTTDALSEANKDVRITKSPHSTCSDGSLLSMGSSEMDDDFYGHSSRNSSKLSLYDRKSLNQDSDTGVDLNESVTSNQLSHSAARHKMAIKPKRTHGAPRRNKPLTVGSILPSTPELNEDISSRSLSSQASDSVSTTAHANPTEPSNDTRIKSASLPSGLSPVSSRIKLTRSRSNAAYLSSGDIFEEDEDSQPQKKDDSNSFFGRLLSRRSGKKKKSVDDSLMTVVPPKRMDEKGRYVHEISNISVKHYPAARQRVDPINIPSDCNPIVSRMHISYPHFPPTLSDLEGGVVVHAVPADKIEVVHTKPIQDLPDVLRPVKKSFSFRGVNQYNNSDSLSLPVHVNSAKDDSDCGDASDAVENKLGVRNVSITEEMVPTILLNRETDDSLLSSSSEASEVTSEPQKIVVSPEIKDTNDGKSIKISSSNFESLDAISSHNQISTVILSESPETIKSEKEFYNATKIKNCANIIIPDVVSQDYHSKSPDYQSKSPDFHSKSPDYLSKSPDFHPKSPDYLSKSPDYHSKSSDYLSKSPDYLSKSPKSLSSYLPKSPKTPTDLSPEDSQKFLEEMPQISPRSIDTISRSSKVPEPVLPPIPAPRTSILKKDPESTVPEFMKIQLNRIENKASSHVILSTSPEKADSPEKLKMNKLEIAKSDGIVAKKPEVMNVDKSEQLAETSKPGDNIDSNGNQAMQEKAMNCEYPKPQSEKREMVEEKPGDKPIIKEAIHKPNVAPKSPLSYAPHKFTINTRQWSSVNTTNNKMSVSHSSEVTTNQEKVLCESTGNKPALPTVKLTTEVTANQKEERVFSDESSSKPTIKRTGGSVIDPNEDEKPDINLSKPVVSSIRHTTEVNSNVDRKPLDQSNKPVLSSSIKVILRSHSNVDEDSLKFCERPPRSTSTENMDDSIIVCNERRPLIKSETSNSKTDNKPKVEKQELKAERQEHSCLKPEGCTTVVLRRKSDVKDLRSSKDDEPELLKVFARRSLKIKDSDIVEAVISDSRESGAKSRDSDKENEEMDSPPEDRKFKEPIKSDLDNEPTKPVFNFISNVNLTKPTLLNTYNPAKYHRSLSHNADDLSNTILLLSNQSENNINNNIFEKRQRSKTLPDLQVQKNTSNNLFMNESDNNNTGDESETSGFKRIQQRAEEWERRAQLAMKKSCIE